jgi:quinone-modifying oxidoreductase subunit QmoC
MVWVQWGLKDQALSNSSIWLCHQCGTCNTYCPRDAKPANVMAALRDYSITHYAFPRFMGNAVNDPKALPLLFAIPALIFLSILAWLGNLTSLPAGQVVFSKFFPILYIEGAFILATGFTAFAALVGGTRYWKAMGRSLSRSSNGAGPQRGLIDTIGLIFRHKRFGQCEGDRVGTRKTYKSHLHRTHLAVFYGFLGLVVTTTSVGIGIYVFGYLTPWPLWHPVKILGNVSGVAVLAACSVFIYRRIADKEKAGKTTYSDWLFLDVLALTTLTGFLSSGFRLAGIAPLAYWTYFIHLVFIFFLLVYIPYSKFAHLVYRTTAMWFHASRYRVQPSVFSVKLTTDC